jgi:hypothetical protein
VRSIFGSTNPAVQMSAADFESANLKYFWRTATLMLGQDVALLLKICLLEGPKILSKTLADELFLPPGEVSKSLHRCEDSGLLYWSDLEKRALLDFPAYGLRHVFPPKSGTLVRGVPTAAAAEPLKSHFQSGS